MLEFLATDIAMTFVGIVLFGLLVFFAETEKLFSSIVLIIIAIVGFHFLTDLSVFSWVAENPITLVALVFAYLLIGAGYTAFWEWRNYCKENRDPGALELFLAENEGSSEEDYYKSPRHFKLHPSNHYYFLTNAMLHWPFLLFWTLLHDPITWLAKTLYDLMGGIFLKIAVTMSQAGK